jgi:hypothetical protein
MDGDGCTDLETGKGIYQEVLEIGKGTYQEILD